METQTFKDAPAIPDTVVKMPRFRAFNRYAVELVIVFAGVLAAFFISDWRQSYLERERRADILFLVYQDFDRFCTAGDTTNPQGFLRFFDSVERDVDSLVTAGILPAGYAIMGDYWQIEAIDALLQSGQLNGLESNLFLNIARFHSIHENFLSSIERFNTYYTTYMLPLAGVKVNKDDAAVRARIELLQLYASGMQRSAAITVDAAVMARNYLAKDARIVKRLESK
jgi:hypothetical protein